MVDLKTADSKTIIVELVIAALGLYLALAISDAVKKSIDKIVPQDGDGVKAAWISAAIAAAVVIAAVFIIVRSGILGGGNGKKE